MVKTIMKKIGTPTLGSFYKRRILSQTKLKKIKLPEKSKTLQIKKTLWGFRLISGKNSIDCSSKKEAEYLRIFIEAEWEKVKIPKDSKTIKNLLVTLKKISQKVKDSLIYYTDGILDEKIKDQVESLVWRRVLEYT